MDITSLFRVAASSLWRNKSRSLLTTLGMVIGVAAVILLVSIGQGLSRYVSSQFEAMGSNTLYVMPFKATDSQGRFRGQGGPPSGTIKGFSRADLRAVERAGYPVAGAIPLIEKMVEVSYRGKTASKFSMTSTADYPKVRSAEVESGRFFSETDDLKGRRIAVLGYDAKEDLFGGESAVGKKIKISSAEFTVAGVVKKLGSGASLGQNIDDMVYLPLSAGEKLFNVDRFDFIGVKVASAGDIPEAAKMIEKIMAKRRDKDEFSVLEQRQILETITGILGALTAGIGGIAAISLLVGGIGIMNIMLVSVTERTREIGLRKAVGATPRLILLQFLIESSVLSILGGLTGIGLGAGGSLILNRFFPTAVTTISVILAFGVSAGVGIIFGILPARRAAKLSPVEALRYE